MPLAPLRCPFALAPWGTHEREPGYETHIAACARALRPSRSPRVITSTLDVWRCSSCALRSTLRYLRSSLVRQAHRWRHRAIIEQMREPSQNQAARLCHHGCKRQPAQQRQPLLPAQMLQRRALRPPTHLQVPRPPEGQQQHLRRQRRHRKWHLTIPTFCPTHPASMCSWITHRQHLI